MLKLVQYYVTDFFKQESGIANVSRILGFGSLVTGFMFSAILLSNILDQEKDAHFYNAMVMARSIEHRVNEAFMMERNPSRARLLTIDGQAQFNRDSIGDIVGYNHLYAFTLRDMIEKNYIQVNNDATRSRLSVSETAYDLDASKVQLFYKTVDGSDSGLVSEILYMVNLAGQTSTTNNAPYSANSPFFYLVSFVDSGIGVYGSFNVGSSEITLLDTNGNLFEGVLDVAISSVSQFILLPKD